ncbi:MAG: hypothetical protein J4428_04415 [Candidatus Aenigmarchaeota archaeon]|nr:hypothetical protein [Candidatus Aenigmarchaeota archaeon]
MPKEFSRQLKEDIIFSTLNVTTKGVISASILTFVLLLIVSLGFAFITNNFGIISLLVVLPMSVTYLVYSYPKFMSQVLKIQTGDEAIKIVLYMVIYLKLHPNFEGAVNFAAAHSKGPLATDIKKAMWDIHAGKYKTVEEALSAYMAKWRVWNEDFVRSVTLLYNVLIEPSEIERENILKKSLNFLLTNTERRMKVYVEDISGPINVLYFLGMLLPVMGIIMFPLISMFLHSSVNPFYLGIGYILVLPLLLLFLVNRIILKRPSAFIIPDISKHPELPPTDKYPLKFFGKTFLIPIVPTAILVSLLVMIYGVVHFVDLYSNLSTASEGLKMELLKKEAEFSLENLAATFSVTFGVAILVYLYFYMKSAPRIGIRNEIKNIEGEFQLGLYSLGNFLSEGYPIEKAIQKSLDEYEKLGLTKSPTFNFFSLLYNKMKNLGTDFSNAVFGKNGIIRIFPSVLIEEIMRILSDASSKSSTLLGNVAKTIGSYLESLNVIEAKIRELLEDIRTSVRLESSFVIPLVCAMVGVLGIFFLNMLRGLSCQLQTIEKSLGVIFLQNAAIGVGSVLNDLVGNFTQVMPMTVLQIIVGIYTVEIISIFSLLLNGIENGFDRTSRDHIIAKNLLSGMLVYAAVSIVALIAFQLLIIKIITQSGGPVAC